MKSSTMTLGSLATCIVISCATGAEHEIENPPPGRSASPAATGARDGADHGWKIVQAADFNVDGMA